MLILTQEELDRFYILINLRQFKTGECKLIYLQEAIDKYLEHVPFSNVFLLENPVNLRIPYTFEQIKNQILNNQGGFCQIKNYFFICFLNTIGYDVELYKCDFDNKRDSHTSILVKNVKTKGDRYLVDVGNTSYWIPIDLSFEDKTPVFSFMYAKTYFIWDQERNLVQYLFRNNEYKPLYKTYLSQPSIKDFESLSYQNHIYTDPNATLVSLTFYIMRFPQSGTLAIKEETMYVEDREHKLTPVGEKFKDVEDFLQCVKTYFPNLNLEQCRKAYINIQNNKIMS